MNQIELWVGFNLFVGLMLVLRSVRGSIAGRVPTSWARPSVGRSVDRNSGCFWRADLPLAGPRDGA